MGEAVTVGAGGGDGRSGRGGDGRSGRSGDGSKRTSSAEGRLGQRRPAGRAGFCLASRQRQGQPGIRRAETGLGQAEQTEPSDRTGPSGAD